MDQYKWDAMNRFSASLSSTNVVSDDYKGTLTSYLLIAVSEAHKDGVQEGERRANKRRDEGEQH